MIIVSSAFGNYIDDCTGCLAELGFETGCQNLELGDRLLIKLSRGTTIDRVLIAMPINQKIVVSASLAQNRVCVITFRIGLAVNCRSRNKLEKVQAFAEPLAEGENQVKVWMEREDGCWLQQAPRLSATIPPPSCAGKTIDRANPRSCAY